MSFAQDLGAAGGFASPRVMREAFREVLNHKGEYLMLYHRPQVVNCPCWNDVFGTSDTDCATCKGTGKILGFDAEPAAVFSAAVFLHPEGRQDQHQKLLTRVGPIETLDGRMYCEGKWFDTIKLGDVIVYMPQFRTTGIELRVIAKVPRTANNGEVIFVRCDLERQPTAEVQGSSVQETL